MFLGFCGGLYYSDYGLVTGSVIFTNLKSSGDKSDTTVSDVFLIGERKFLRMKMELIDENYPLYDKTGNRLLRFIEDSKINQLPN
jgi:hypothetical protein